MAPRRFAATTDVPVARSREELRSTLEKYGADDILDFSSRKQGIAAVQFRYNARWIKLSVELPNRQDFTLTESGRTRDAYATDAAYEQEVMRRWRVLNLLVRAKLEAVADDEEAFDREFAGYMMLPDGTTIAEHLTPHLDTLYSDGIMPPFM